MPGNSFRRLARSFILTTGLAALTGALPALAENYPEAVQHLQSRGIDIVGQFEAPGGMTGYIGEMQGRPVSVFLTPDGRHVIMGTLLAEDGTNISQQKVQELLMEPRFAQAWNLLEESRWVRDGSAEAETVLYTFTDPNCPYCYRFRQAALPWIEAGKVQLRHILVGVIREDSAPKAATLLAADDPEAALQAHHDNYQQGGVRVDRSVVSQTYSQVVEHSSLMENLGLQATPSTFYYNEEGKVAMKAGVPDAEELEIMMGSPLP